MARFLAQETAAAAVLLAAVVVALVWANSPWADGYHGLWEREIELNLGGWHPLVVNGHAMTFESFVGDALMAIFFFVVGLEIATEVTVGDLRDRSVAALPAIGALGGMVAPAVIYTVLNATGSGASGWAIPTATDIALAAGVLALLGPRIPHALRIFLLTLAIVDDIGAILVIAVFYTEGVSMSWLAAASCGLAAIVLGRRARIWYTSVNLVIGVFVWYATFRSGVHATIAGVAIGLLTPTRPLAGPRRLEALEDILSGDTIDPAELRDASWQLRESVPVSTRLMGLLSPWTGFLIVPAFALANAGVPVSVEQLGAVASSRIAWGVVLGLVVGKPVGIVVATQLARRRGWGRLADGIGLRHILGVGCVAGVGFTVATFIARLSFDAPGDQNTAVLAVVAASIAAACIGALILVSTSRSSRTA